MINSKRLLLEGFGVVHEKNEKELHKTENFFARCYDEHAGYYQVTYQKAHELETEAKNFKALAVRWIEVWPRHPKAEEMRAKGETSDYPVFLLANGSRFVENDEFSELARLRRSLKVISGCLTELRNPWLADVEHNSLSGFQPLITYSTFKELHIQKLIIMNNEEAMLNDLLFTVNMLRKVLALLDNMDFSPNFVRKDLCGQRIIPRLLIVASAMIDRGASSARSAVQLIQGNEQLWRMLNDEA